MTYLTYQGILRNEGNPTTIANLRRKGWVDAPPKPADNAQWDNGQWMIPAPVPPPGPSLDERVEATETILRMLIDAEIARQQGGGDV